MRLGAVAVVVGLSAPALAEPLAVISHALRYDAQARSVQFEILFNREPDYFTLDPMERQADSFQIYLDTKPGHQGWGGTSPFPWESIVRGEEIHIEGNIRIRDHLVGPSPKPHSGGWGALAGSVPYVLIGATQTFDAPFAMLNTNTGVFRYRIELYNYGTWNGAVYDGQTVPVPSPGAAVFAACAMGWAVRRRRPVR